MAMLRTPVRSSAILSVGHDGQTLEVELAGGRVYRYAGVTPDVAEALRTAESPGRYFATAIKGRFTPTRVDESSDA